MIWDVFSNPSDSVIPSWSGGDGLGLGWVALEVFCDPFRDTDGGCGGAVLGSDRVTLEVFSTTNDSTIL